MDGGEARGERKTGRGPALAGLEMCQPKYEVEPIGPRHRSLLGYYSAG